jgi:hypothetical protein
MSKWVLLNANTKTLHTGHWDNDTLEYIYEDISSPPGIIFNIIVYDGVAPYTPPTGYSLVQVDDDKQIGDFIGL